MATASGREIYKLGKDKWGNREVVTVEDGQEHNFPAAAKYAYGTAATQFPYALPA
jgi:hypothetical protein